MKYLIDTDIASYYLRGKFNISKVFERKGISNIRISRVSVAELEVLAFKNPNSKINLTSIDFLSQNLGIIEIDKLTWRNFSKMKADILTCGKTKGDIDILIASIAKQYNMIIVTNNTSHYEGLVKVENWVEDNK